MLMRWLLCVLGVALQSSGMGFFVVWLVVYIVGAKIVL